MYLSHILIDVGDNPDRPRPGRTWLHNLYRVHQRLSMAFPSDPAKSHDPLFVKPYEKDNFLRPKFLFRVDQRVEEGLPSVIILVQSDIKPDWNYAFQNARYLISAEPECRKYSPVVKEGEIYRFRLTANPTRRLSERSTNANGLLLTDYWKNGGGKGKRVPVPAGQLVDWLIRHGTNGGFGLLDEPVIQTGYTYVNKTLEKGEGQRLFYARYEGRLEVTNPVLFSETIRNGLGSAKGFGFGLLSIAK